MASPDGSDEIRRGLEALVAAWRAAGTEPKAAPFEAMRERCAGLAAAAEAAGQWRLAELAGVAEIMLTPLARGTEPPDALVLRTVDDYIEGLRRLDPGAPAEQPACEPVVERVVWLETRDDTAVARLRALLQDMGWRLEIVPDAVAAWSTAAGDPPELILVDMDGAVDQARPLKATTLCRDSHGHTPTVVALAARGTAARRLAAARAGAAGFWLKGITRDLLAAELDRLALSATESATPLRILLRDDSRTQTAYYRNVLQRAGMAVEVAASADAVFEALLRRPPDLLLLDLHMPDYDGAELTRAVRQLPGLSHLPVVFLSMETDTRRQLEALAAGGDDFLVKPVSGGHLLRVVRVRAERGRVLRREAGRDAATGALTGEVLRARIRHEQWRAERDQRPLLLALLYPDAAVEAGAGSDALAALVAGVRERLRRTDVLGRLGPDELVVVLPGAGEAEARELLTPLLQANDAVSGWRLALAAHAQGLDPEGLLRAAGQALDAQRLPET